MLKSYIGTAHALEKDMRGSVAEITLYLPEKVFEIH